MKWTNSYRSFGLKTKRSTGLKTIEHKHLCFVKLLQEFIDLCLGFNVKPSNVLDEVIAKAARARAERTADEVADRIAANPDDFDVAASIDPHKRDEANTPRE